MNARLTSFHRSAASSVCLAVIAVTNAVAGTVSVWTTHCMDRVMRDSPPSAWKAAISCARGEWEGLQLVVNGKPSAIKGTAVAASALQGPGGSVIPAPVVLREHYVAIKHSSESAPLPAGDYPDALVPQTVPWQRLPDRAAINQPFWVDVYVPPESKPGDYTGRLLISLPDGTTQTQDMVVHVWDFALPDTPTLKSSIFIVWRRIAKVHGFDVSDNEAPPQLRHILDDYYDMLVEHRLSPHEVWATYPDPVDPLSDASFQRMQDGLRQHLLQRRAGLIGLPLWPDWPVSDPLGKGREAALDYVVRYHRMCEKLGCASRLYKIFGELDEPKSKEDYDRVRAWGTFFHELREHRSVNIPLLVTEQIEPENPEWGSLAGSVDIWDAHVGDVWRDLEAPDAKQLIPSRIKAGDQVWTYPALVQTPDAWKALHGHPTTLGAGQPPVWLTDYPPMNYRILGWLCARQGITGISYWDTSYWPEDHDVWTDNGTYPHGESTYNGDGFLIYPAHLESHGREGPVASLRLKWLRECMDDHDYLQLLRDRGFDRTAMDLSATFARGFGDWKDDIAALMRARDGIAEALERLNNHKPEAQ